MAAGDLAGFIEDVTGQDVLRVDEDLGGGFVRLRVSEAERRQARQDIRSSEDVVLELLRNARDAGARIVCVATRREGALRETVVIDDGAGIPEYMWDRVFEPRVTSRLDSFHADQWGVHGRGMALYSIACNSVEHRIVASGEGLGTAIRVVSDARELPERADQSTVPRLHVGDDGRKVMRGPRNINRIAAEFAIAQRGSCLVYLGSPVQMLAVLVRHGMHALSRVERSFAADPQTYPVCLRPALAATPAELAQVAESLGLAVSERSARRVLDGAVESPPPFLEAVAVEEPTASRKLRAGGDDGILRTSRPHPSDADLRAFGAGVMAAYRPLAEGYYLDPGVEPRVRVARDGLHVVIPFAEREGGAR